MCGIVGCVGKIYLKEENVFKTLLQLDTIRGHHSTGVFRVGSKIGDWRYLKDVGTPFDMMSKDSFTKQMQGMHAGLFGHNRAATRGAVTIDNAHPFWHGNILGCHNGTLDDFNNLVKDKNDKKFEVDSEAIIANINAEGIEETLKKLKGAFTLCYYDSGNHTMNLVRNDKRPMFTCWSKDRKTLFWASEPWMLHVAMLKHDVEREEKIESLPEGKLLSVEVPVVAGSQITEVAYTQEGVEFYKAPAFRADTDCFNRRYWGEEDGGSNWYEASKARESERAARYAQVVKAAEAGTQETPTRALMPVRGVQSVIPFQQQAATKARLTNLLVGKDIVFSIIGKDQKGSLEYISCEIEDYENAPELRIFMAGKEDPKGTMLLGSTNFFGGKVRSCTIYGDECYVTIDNRTLKEIPFDELVSTQAVEDVPTDVDDDVESELDTFENTHTGYQGRLLTGEQYARVTNGGCGMCSSYASLSGRDKLFWIDETHHLCNTCAESEAALVYHDKVYSNQIGM